MVIPNQGFLPPQGMFGDPNMSPTNFAQNTMATGNVMMGGMPLMADASFGPDIQARLAQMMQSPSMQQQFNQTQPPAPTAAPQPSMGNPGMVEPGSAQPLPPAPPFTPSASLPANATPTNIFGDPFQFQDQRQQDAFGRFMTAPDYQFRLNEGIRAMDASAAQRGLLLSGNQLRALQEFGQGIAAGEFGNYYNRMAGIAGLSQPTDFGGFAQLGAQTLGGLQGARGNLTANLGNIQGAGANAQGAILGNVFGNIPFQQIGQAIGGVFGGGAPAPSSGFSTGGMFRTTL